MMSDRSVQTLLSDAAGFVLELAKKKGCQTADLVAARSSDFEVKVADGEIVTLSQAVSKGLGLRVIVDQKMGFCTTSDFGKDSLTRVVDKALALAHEAAPDEFNGIANAQPGHDKGVDLDLYDPAIPQLSAETKIDWAHQLESAARQVDPRVKKFRDSGIASGEAETLLATSTGVVRTLRATGLSAWCNPIAEHDGELQTEFWYDSQSHLGDLESIAAIGRIAGQRAVRMLGAKPVKTQKVAVVFEPAMAAGLFAGMLGGLDGDMVYKKASFLADRLGKKIAVDTLTLVDDPLVPRGSGSSPFDGEGLPTQKREIVSRGTLSGFFYDSYTAKKAKVKPTHSAKRSWSSLPHAGPFNFFCMAGSDDPQEMVRSLDRGLILTRGLGRGLNTVSGEYSRGANGLWVENGEIVHAVQEVTLAGDFLAMLNSIDRIGTDFQMRGSIGAPSIRIAEMTLSGQ